MTLSGHQETTIDLVAAPAGTDDYSRTFATLRGKLIGSNGERYVAFVRGLKPRYAIVYRDIAVGYVLLAVSFGLTVIAPAWGIPKLIAALLGACLVGYWVAYLQLFLHEGAHYNLAGTKDRSDRICDFAIVLADRYHDRSLPPGPLPASSAVGHHDRHGIHIFLSP